MHLKGREWGERSERVSMWGRKRGVVFAMHVKVHVSVIKQLETILIR